ncbi:hypothetical protein MTY66_50770 [Mycolicibacterium sp. TY66]|uniref:hypothetical protein n=1 Tax=unclassified Mycolicibacterium TaxID=2636767 RepID=UPI0011D4E34B|nr:MULTISPECIES: hypothetical protein [unclassified Mycolicibacterium]TXH19789.1 MAG: hypothetical protein E6R06_23730 [Mycobacterium sp.]BCI83452.1 hypothetical protein MTY66_50770 [Mycolicibacterium sp. TY66]BCJ78904.1 hypothetical protein MTY81_02770 [Mycolicibacterium sp. TY81]
MTPALATASPPDLRHVPFRSLRASLGAMASRGETSGPRVEATRAALEWQSNRATLMKMGFTEDQAEDLADVIEQKAAQAAEAEAVAR